MSLTGRWRMIAMPDYVEDYRDMMEPAYIEFADDGSGEFAFGCVTGQIFGSVTATTSPKIIDQFWLCAECPVCAG